VRIDTVVEVPKWFWGEFAKNCGVFQLGEAADSRMKFVADYQNYIDGLLNFPLYYTLRDVFIFGKSMYLIEQNFFNTKNIFKDPTLLGNFIGNHDFPRVLSMNSNVKRFENMIAFIITSSKIILFYCLAGIPVFYYGDEQNFDGGNDPFCRESLWGHTDRKHPTYELVSKLVHFRIRERLWEKKQVQRYCDDNVYAFTMDNVLALFTNSDMILERTIIFHDFKENTKLCDLINPWDCVYVKNKRIDVELKSEFKIYIVDKNEFAEAMSFHQGMSQFYFAWFGSYT
jgi:alpha-amylase